jgi:hypothetical protein
LPGSALAKYELVDGVVPAKRILEHAPAAMAGEHDAAGLVGQRHGVVVAEELHH